MRAPLILAGLGALALAAPVAAQETTAVPQPSVGADTDAVKEIVTVAAGVISVPSYEGSDNNNFIPFVQARGTIDGYFFATQGTQLYVDLIRNTPGPGIDFQLGPVVSVNLNRSRRKGIDDRQVEALGIRKVALELGGYVGIGKTGVITSPYDNISVNVAYVHDVTNIHDSYVVTPQINYNTPLSRKAYVSISASAAYAGNGYARSYFGVDAPGALRSGLPVFNARKGWKNYSVGALGNYSLTGDLLGGVSVIGNVSYSRLLNDFKDSPVTSIAGSRDQWYYALGLAYTF